MSIHLKKNATESTNDLREEDDFVQNEERKTKNLSIKEKLISWKNLITVEPVLFCYMFAASLAQGATEKLQFEMGCRVNAGLNDTVCSDINVGTKYVAVLLSQAHAWSYPIATTVSGILVLVFGSFSDRYKVRKPFFILPPLGDVFACIGLLFCATYINSWPVEIYVLMSTILPAFFGSGQTMLMAVYSYITDISSTEERTARIGFVEIVSLVLLPIGQALSGILFLNVGYYAVLSISLLINVFAVLYGLFYIKESNSSVKRNKNLCIDLFDIKTVVKDMIKIIFRKRVAHRRILLILSYICYILLKGPITAESRYIRNYLYEEFKWNLDILGYFAAFDITVHILGMILAITVFTKKFKMNDLLLAAMACIFKIVSGIWYAFGKSAVLFCFGPLIGMFSGLFVLALRSIVTKLVDENEIAKAQAVFAICEALAPIIYSTVYFKFYERTHDSFLGAFYLLSIVLITPALILLLIMYAIYRNENTEDTNWKENEEQKDEDGIDNMANDIEISKL